MWRGGVGPRIGQRAEAGLALGGVRSLAIMRPFRLEIWGQTVPHALAIVITTLPRLIITGFAGIIGAEKRPRTRPPYFRFNSLMAQPK
jgi:hypothetical protein